MHIDILTFMFTYFILRTVYEYIIIDCVLKENLQFGTIRQWVLAMQIEV